MMGSPHRDGGIHPDSEIAHYDPLLANPTLCSGHPVGKNQAPVADSATTTQTTTRISRSLPLAIFKAAAVYRT